MTLASTEGGKIVMDGYSDPLDASEYSAHDIITLGFLQKDSFKEMLETTIPFTKADASDYKAIFLVGGAGPMYTFRGNKDLAKLFASFYEAGKPSAAVCHGTTMLLEATTSDGKPIVENKTWTGFTNAEEDGVDQNVGQKMQPYRIQEEAEKLEFKTTFKAAAPWSSFAIADGNLITGQQQNSGGAAAKLLVEQLSAGN